ncbi:Integrator complex subunit 7 [Oopsacas minuta]|uniref:Integrator complex subunit 7 n=1 Tax=Oopsacas minuta TaxID=111878 RepID=A0AAV7K3P3_9METZ|nr:Integrator complex subunit 7 [Oopsacas minuta]
MSNLLKLAEMTPHSIIRAEALFVIFRLAQVDFMDTLFDELNIFERCSTLAYHKDIRVCLSACKVLVEVVTRKYEIGNYQSNDNASLQSLVDQTDSRVVPLFGIMFIDEESSEFIKSSIISLAQRLSQINQLFAQRLSSVISTTLSNLPTPCEKSEALYRTLTVILVSSSLDLSHLIPLLISHLESTETLQYIFSIIHLLMLIHYAPLNLSTRSSFRIDVLPVIIRVLNSLEHPNKLWFQYRIAKLALTNNFHELSLPIISSLSRLPTTEQYRIFFQSIAAFSRAETLLMVSCDSIEVNHHMEIDNESYDGTLCSFDPSILLNVIKLYCCGISSLQTCRTLPNREFWECFLQLRSDLLSFLHQVLIACNQIRLMPRSTLSQPDRTVQIFNKCIKKISISLDLLQECRYRSFSADSSTLSYLNIIELSYNTLVMLIRKIILKEDYNLQLIRDKLLKAPKLKFLRQYTDLCEVSLTHLSKNLHFINDPVSHQHINFIKTFCFSLIVTPFYFPLYFFHCRHNLQIQLSFSNLPEKPQDPITLSLDTSLSFSVEGIISEKQVASSSQKIKGVTVKTHVRPDNNSVRSSPSPNTQTLTKQADLQQDNFNASFLIHFTHPSHYYLDISVHLVDEDGTTWLATNLDSKPPQWRVLYAIEDNP